MVLVHEYMYERVGENKGAYQEFRALSPVLLAVIHPGEDYGLRENAELQPLGLDWRRNDRAGRKRYFCDDFCSLGLWSQPGHVQLHLIVVVGLVCVFDGRLRGFGSGRGAEMGGGCDSVVAFLTGLFQQVGRLLRVLEFPQNPRHDANAALLNEEDLRLEGRNVEDRQALARESVGQAVHGSRNVVRSSGGLDHHRSPRTVAESEFLRSQQKLDEREPRLTADDAETVIVHDQRAEGRLRGAAASILAQQPPGAFCDQRSRDGQDGQAPRQQGCLEENGVERQGFAAVRSALISHFPAGGNALLDRGIAAAIQTSKAPCPGVLVCIRAA